MIGASVKTHLSARVGVMSSFNISFTASAAETTPPTAGEAAETEDAE